MVLRKVLLIQAFAYLL